jgi:1-phosphatidylinositol phosphodiesterase
MRHTAVAVLSTSLLLLATLATTAALAGTASAQPTTSSDAFNSLTVESHPDWMAGLPAQTGLNALTIPGTHDTMAIHGGWAPWAYEAQEDHGDSGATLDAQLTAGVRAIDIRVRVVNNDTAFAIHHTDVYQNANFDDVLTHARAFLTAHPGETVLMDLHGECDGDSTEGGSGSSSIGHCADDPATITQADRTRIFDGYVARYPGLFYAPSVTGTSTADMPTLGQARGHIVLTTFTGPRGGIYGGYGLTQLTTGDYNQYVENDWTQCNTDSKWGEAQANMVKANASSNAMYTTYLSANCAPFGAGPADVAGAVNPHAVDFLTGGATNHVGVVLTDFPGHALIAADPPAVLPAGRGGAVGDRRQVHGRLQLLVLARRDRGSVGLQRNRRAAVDRDAGPHAAHRRALSGRHGRRDRQRHARRAVDLHRGRQPEVVRRRERLAGERRLRPVPRRPRRLHQQRLAAGHLGLQRRRQPAVDPAVTVHYG